MRERCLEVLYIDGAQCLETLMDGVNAQGTHAKNVPGIVMQGQGHTTTATSEVYVR